MFTKKHQKIQRRVTVGRCLASLLLLLLTLAGTTSFAAAHDGEEGEEGHTHEGDGAQKDQPTPLPAATPRPTATPLPLNAASAPGQEGAVDEKVQTSADIGNVDAIPNASCGEGAACAVSVSPILPVALAQAVAVDLDLICESNRVRVTASQLGFRKLFVTLDGFEALSLQDLPSGESTGDILLGDGSLTNRGRSIDHEIVVTTDEGALVAKAAIQGCVLAMLEPSPDCGSINATLVNSSLRDNPYAFKIVSPSGTVQAERDFDVVQGVSAAFQTELFEDFARSEASIFVRGGDELFAVDLGAVCGGIQAQLYPSCSNEDALLTLRNISPWDQVVDINISTGDQDKPLGIEVPSLSATQIGLSLPTTTANVVVTQRSGSQEVLRSVVNTTCGENDLAGFSVWRGVDGRRQVGLVSGATSPTEITLSQGDDVLETVLVAPDQVAVVQLVNFEGGAVTAQGSDGNEETLTLPGEAGDGSKISDWLKGSTLVVLVGAALLFEIALLTIILPRRRRQGALEE